MDISDHKPNLFVFKVNENWFYKRKSWKNKYINRDVAQGRKKLFGVLLYPVALTDAWHLFKSLMLLFIAVGTVLFAFEACYYLLLDTYFERVLIAILLVRSLFGAGFYIGYNYIFVRHEPQKLQS
jgi:hypothetical protein